MRYLILIILSILCIQSNAQSFYWSPPMTVSGNTATATILGITYTYTSTSPVITSPGPYAYATFPSPYGLPNTTCIRNEQATTNKIVFSNTVSNPVIAFASIGNGNLTVPIKFSDTVEVLFGQSVSQPSPDSIRGLEGYCILRYLGDYDSVSFKYGLPEIWANFQIAFQGFALPIDTNTIQPIKKNEGIIYPNPADNSLTVNAKGRVRIISINGKVVYEAIQKGKIVINTSNFVRGIYTVMINNDPYKILIK